ncbi:hypothetical protein KP509_10G029000 [Ceratopteris richardii]|nr:hypothetical protein KP509_10G029000 [Ceratopteris richardii]
MYSMGGLAEYCVVPAHGLAVLPDSLPFSESAILGCAVFTAYGALRNAADMRAGETIAIIGVGGVGSSCLQLARAFGGQTVIAVDIDEKKLEKAKALGATHTVNGLKENVPDKIKEFTHDRGVDIAIEALGNPKTFIQSTLAIRDGGRAVIIGLAPMGCMAEIDLVRLVRRQVKIIGSYGARARQDLPTILGLAEMGAFDIKSTVSEKHTLEEANSIYEALHRGQVLGRAIVEM